MQTLSPLQSLILLLSVIVSNTSLTAAPPDIPLSPREQQIVAAARSTPPSATPHQPPSPAADKLAALPPLGWNSYDAFGDSVTEAETLANAAWMKEHLQPLGWDTVVVDFRWYDPKADGVRPQNPEANLLDVHGRFVPAPDRFPSARDGAGFKPLADKLHALGFKFGIHLMRGIPRQAVEADLPIADSPYRASQAALPANDPNRECPWNRDCYGVDGSTPAGRAWYASEAKLAAQWGVDYIKCDDLSNLQRGRFYGASEIEALAAGIQASGRAIILSLSPGPAPLNCAPHLKKFANLWRISGDFWDRWKALNENFDLLAAWSAEAAPGTWPDADMLPLGHLCQRNCDFVGQDHWTHFTRDEQLTMVSLWCIASSPLMVGGNLPDNDPWTTSLLTNPEVLAVNQDPAGQSAHRMSGPPVPAETWTKLLADGSQAVGLFNRTDKLVRVSFPWRHLGFMTTPAVRDLWLRSDLPKSDDFTADLPPHACLLLKVR